MQQDFFMSQMHENYMEEVNSFFDKLPEHCFEVSNCPFCPPSHERIELFRKKSLQVMRCECGHVYSGNQPTQLTLDSFYSKSNAMTHWSDLKKTESQLRKQDEKYQKVVDFLVDNNVESVLDVGCGNGHFLKMLPDTMERVGIDQNKVATEVAAKDGVIAYNFSIEETLESMEAANHKYDCITLFGTLEHVKYPIELLSQLARFTRRYLIVIVPNVNSSVVRQTWEQCFTFCPQHLNYFSDDSLYEAFARANLKEEDYWTIEPETLPTLKSQLGFNPYQSVPNWVKLTDYKELDEITLMSKQGYKLVYIGSK
jgi:SAM-dependent methyltransferase